MMEKPVLSNGKDVEMQDGRRPSHVAGTLRGPTVNEDDVSTMSVGKQIELESSNSIQYRTCSSQKVRKFQFFDCT